MKRSTKLFIIALAYVAGGLFEIFAPSHRVHWTTIGCLFLAFSFFLLWSALEAREQERNDVQ